MPSVVLRQDFVYTCTIMFGPELMQAMAAAADDMRPGAIFVTVMLPLPSECWEIICAEVGATLYSFSRVCAAYS